MRGSPSSLGCSFSSRTPTQHLQHSLYGAVLDSLPALFIVTGVVLNAPETCGVLSLHPLIYLSQQLNGTLSQERPESLRG